MKYFFSASSRNISENIKIFKFIQGTLDKLGHLSTRDWIEEAYQKDTTNKSIEKSEWKRIHNHVSEAILNSDFIIAYISEPSFSVGYQVALSIQHKKPILILSKEPIEEIKNSFGTNIDSELISFKRFSEDTFEESLKDFVRNYCLMGKPKRFSFFIDQRIHNFIRGEAFAKDKTKAEVLREILDTHIKNNS